MEKEIYVTKKFISNSDVEELGIELKEKFGYDYDSNEIGEFHELEIGMRSASSYSDPIEINKLIKILENLKALGSNYVSLSEHVDHIGYEITGLSIYESNTDEISAYQEELFLRKEKNRKILELQHEINNLKNS